MKPHILSSNTPANFRVFSTTEEEGILFQSDPIPNYLNYTATSLGAGETILWVIQDDIELLTIFLSSSSTVPAGSTLTIQVRDFTLANILYSVNLAANNIGGNMAMVAPPALPTLIRKNWMLLLKPSYAINSLNLVAKPVYIQPDIPGIRSLQI